MFITTWTPFIQEVALESLLLSIHTLHIQVQYSKTVTRTNGPPRTKLSETLL